MVPSARPWPAGARVSPGHGHGRGTQRPGLLPADQHADADRHRDRRARRTTPKRGRDALNHRRPATHAAVLLCRSMLEDTPHSVAMFRSSLRRLAIAGTDGTHPLGGVPLLPCCSTPGTRRTHSAARDAGRHARRGRRCPSPRPADAADAAHLLEQAIRPLATPMPLTELNHAVGRRALGALVALGAKWRTGTPFVLTEHESYLAGTAARPDRRPTRRPCGAASLLPGAGPARVHRGIEDRRAGRAAAPLGARPQRRPRTRCRSCPTASIRTAARRCAASRPNRSSRGSARRATWPRCWRR